MKKMTENKQTMFKTSNIGKTRFSESRFGKLNRLVEHSQVNENVKCFFSLVKICQWNNL